MKFGVLCSNALHIRNKDLWRLWPTKTLDTNWVWLWTERYWGYDWPVARQSVIMCACWWRAL